LTINELLTNYFFIIFGGHINRYDVFIENSYKNYIDISIFVN